MAKTKKTKFLDLAMPTDGRIKLLVDNLMLGLSLDIDIAPSMSARAYRKVSAALNVSYRVGYNDGAVDERRTIERAIKRVL